MIFQSWWFQHTCKHHQTSPDIKLRTTSVPSVTDKNQNNSVLYSQNTIQNDASIINKNNVQSCETARK